jgi:hypothetical protein
MQAVLQARLLRSSQGVLPGTGLLRKGLRLREGLRVREVLPAVAVPREKGL